MILIHQTDFPPTIHWRQEQELEQKIRLLKDLHPEIKMFRVREEIDEKSGGNMALALRLIDKKLQNY